MDPLPSYTMFEFKSLFYEISFGLMSSSGLLVLALLAMLAINVFLNRSRIESQRYLIFSVIFLLCYVSLPNYWIETHIRQRFWIPAMALFLLSYSTIRFSREQALRFALIALVASMVLSSVIGFELHKDAMLFEDYFLEVRAVDISENSTVLPMFWGHNSLRHMFGYYCLEKRCLHQNSWFNAPEVYNGGFINPMPTPGEIKGWDINRTHLVYDYYFFVGREYEGIENRADELNLTEVYISDKIRVFE
jgi:hypothetical protein